MIPIIVIFVIVSVILLVLLAVYIGLHINKKRYTAFISKNSLSLRSLKKINSEFTFFPEVNYNQYYTYDNEDYFNTISCTDYLIYQLQYQAETIGRQIEKTKRNKVEYQRYINKIAALPYGEFSAPIGKLKQKILIKTEKKLCEQASLPLPPTQFFLTVILYCSQINGRIYANKSETFSGETILILIKRLKNKNGTYFKDREIWDAICRVERGKVSNKMRFEIFARDGHRCRYCGISGQYANLEIDHIISISKGGKSTYDNLQTLCHKCNFEKGNKL